MNRKWTSVLALGLVGALIAGPVWGQSGTTPSTPSDATKSETKAGKAMARGGNREQVKAAQQALKDKGHDPGPIDGVMGPQTQTAVKGFQKAEGLKESGRLDNETMAKLGVEAKTSGTEPSSPAASPATGDKPTGPTGAPGTQAPPSASPSGEKSKQSQ